MDLDSEKEEFFDFSNESAKTNRKSEAEGSDHVASYIVRT
jgi:hypothetical protein